VCNSKYIRTRVDKSIVCVVGIKYPVISVSRTLKCNDDVDAKPKKFDKPKIQQ